MLFGKCPFFFNVHIKTSHNALSVYRYCFMLTFCSLRSVKAMYSLLSKANSMQKDMTKVEMMSSHLKSINKYLERLDTTLTSIKPNPDIT